MPAAKAMCAVGISFEVVNICRFCILRLISFYWDQCVNTNFYSFMLLVKKMVVLYFLMLNNIHFSSSMIRYRSEIVQKLCQFLTVPIKSYCIK